jgi:predicted nucleic acid-binding protein
VSLVLDSSVALGWCFEDQHTPAIRLVLQQVVDAGALVPQLWPLEVLNGLAMAERRGRLDTPTRERLEGFLRELPVVLDDDTGPDAWTRTVPLAHRFQLTVYDAAYLELAQRQQLPLASIDESLRRAGTELGLTLLGA